MTGKNKKWQEEPPKPFQLKPGVSYFVKCNVPTDERVRRCEEAPEQPTAQATEERTAVHRFDKPRGTLSPTAARTCANGNNKLTLNLSAVDAPEEARSLFSLRVEQEAARARTLARQKKQLKLEWAIISITLIEMVRIWLAFKG